MMYKTLTLSQRILVPFICSLFFLYYFIKYKKSNLPKNIIYSNLFFSIGCLLLVIFEMFKQNYFLDEFNYLIYPFINIDIIVFVMTIGGIMALKGGFRYVTIVKKRNSLKWLTALLIFFISVYLYMRVF